MLYCSATKQRLWGRRRDATAGPIDETPPTRPGAALAEGPISEEPQLRPGVANVIVMPPLTEPPGITMADGAAVADEEIGDHWEKVVIL